MTQQCVNCPGAVDHSTAECPMRASLPVGVPQVQITGHLDEVDAPLWSFIHAEAQKLERTTGSIDTYNFTRPNGAQLNGCVAVLWNGQTIHAVGLTVRDALNRTQCVRLLAAPSAPAAEPTPAMPQEWWQIIHDTLRNYRMSTLDDGYGGGYPLIDAMTADGQTVAGGIEECTYLADAIWNALPTQAPSLPAAGSEELTAVRCQCCSTEHPHDSYDAGFIAGSGMCQVCDAAMPPKDLPAAGSADQPYPDGIADDLERSDWTPIEALQWYAAGKHFDVVGGRTRIIDTGAVASNALKHASLAYLELKGDAELSELRAALSAQQSAPERVSVPECKLGILGRVYDAPSVCRAYTYQDQPHNDHAWKLGKAAAAVKAGGDWIDTGLSLLEQLQENGFGVFELRALLASHAEGGKA